jgi:amino acid transporter
VFIIVGSLIATAGLLILLALALQHGIGSDGLKVASAGNWFGVPQATIGGDVMFPNLMAMSLTGSWFIVLLIGLGFILNSFQIVCNCYIGCTRIMVAQGLDGLLPDWFAKVNARWKTPVNALLAYFIAALPVIYAFNKVSGWSTKWALGVTFANGVVFMFGPLAAALLPYRAKSLYEASPGAKYKLGSIPWVVIVGVVGAITATLMVLAFLVRPELGLAYSNSAVPYYVVIGTLLLGLVIYLVMRQVRASKGVKVEYAFAEIPPE